MLKYLEHSEELKVGITELQEQLEVLVQIVITLQQVAQQARNEIGQKVFEIFCHEEDELCIASWARWDAQLKGLAELERRWQDTILVLNKREIFKNAIEGKLKVQSRANERLQDQIVEERKEMEHKKQKKACKQRGKSMICGGTIMKKKKHKDSRSPRSQKRVRKWHGRHQEIQQIGLLEKRRARVKKARGG